MLFTRRETSKPAESPRKLVREINENPQEYPQKTRVVDILTNQVARLLWMNAENRKTQYINESEYENNE